MAVYIGKDQPSGWVIKHYGVKGMKWGKRKAIDPANHLATEEKIRDRTEQLLKSKNFREQVTGKRGSKRSGLPSYSGRDRQQIDYFKKSMRRAEIEGKVANPDYYVSPVKGDPHRGEYHAELGEIGAYNRFSKTARGRDNNVEWVYSKQARTNADRAYDEMRDEYRKNNKKKTRIKQH